MVSNIVSQEKDARTEIDNLFEIMSKGQLADRIAVAARLAAAKHIIFNAQEMQSAAEAENSAQQA